jgi:adenylosuccinate synthase
MSSVVVVGAQWGDEGKGKVTDYLASQAQTVVRYQGGSNAGHTVVANGKTFKLHLVPSGAIHANKRCVIGNGVVIDPVTLVQELDGLKESGIDVPLYISERAHVILPYHRLLDQLEEQRRDSGSKIGTTGRGIGPCYVDKAARCGVRMMDLLTPEAFRARLVAVLPAKNELLKGLYGHEGFTVDEIMEQCGAAAQRLAPYVTDTSLLVYDSILAGERVLFEGAQGTLLDLDHGTYPFVTSSSATAGGAATGSGVGPHFLNTVVGVVKAYTTRVGEGPFPSELKDATGEMMRQNGAEFGTTTGRPRRCGWFDAVVVRYAARVNGLQQLAIMKLDVLSGLPELKICVGYKSQGEVREHFPANIAVLNECEPIYETMPGWDEDITAVKGYADLPANARAYLDHIVALTGVPIALVSVGPGRDQTITMTELFS